MKLVEVELQTTASSSTLLWQVLALLIDGALVFLPMFICLNIEMILGAMFIWVLYIPVSEYFFGRTIGMALVGTRIFGLDGGQVPLSAVINRHVARISVVWGLLGWLTLFTKFRVADGYIILRDGETAQNDLRYIVQ